ncbi:MAG: hypothetical protein M1826_003314 [Phylliscum demangeonii]|nr:MAG: hypothetical protein M1826_003314 [Phylliscum demangeonii]
MRLFLLPISTRRNLIYALRPAPAALTGADRATLVDRVTARAANTWRKWEQGDKGWQKAIVGLGNRVLRGIAYEEWGLRSIPGRGPATTRPVEAETVPTSTSTSTSTSTLPSTTTTTMAKSEAPVEVTFPSSIIPSGQVHEILRKLATERQSLHTRRLWWSLIGLPLTLPFVAIPIMPNIPGFYLAYRAWSHRQALVGSKHLEYLVKNELIRPSPSPILDRIYDGQLDQGAAHGNAEQGNDATNSGPSAASSPPLEPSRATDGPETMLLDATDGKRIAEALDVSELKLEVERAVEQVQGALTASRLASK